MSEGYLQRLFDRVASHSPRASQIVPSGPSTSPLALADQRLNDPRFAEDFSFGSTGLASLEDDTSELVRYPLPSTLGQIPSDFPVSRIPTFAPTRDVVDPDQGSTPPPVDQPPDFRIPRVGEVLDSDFVQPETEGELPEAGPILPDRPVARTDQVDILPEAPLLADVGTVREPPKLQEPLLHEAEPITHPDVQEVTPAQISPPETEYPIQAPEHIQAETAAAEPAEFVIREQASEPLAVEPATARLPVEPQEAIEVYPPPVTPEPLPVIRETPAPVPDPPVTTETTKIVGKEVESEPVPAEPRQVRTMTAAEASVIGPLQRRQRAVTLFGLRRR